MDRIKGCLLLWKCLVACLFFDESQHATWPHSRHIRKCTHVSTVFMQSSQTRLSVLVNLTWLRCVHSSAIVPSSNLAIIERRSTAPPILLHSRLWPQRPFRACVKTWF